MSNNSSPNTSVSFNSNLSTSSSSSLFSPASATADRYAALKDLDEQLRETKDKTNGISDVAFHHHGSGNGANGIGLSIGNGIVDNNAILSNGVNPFKQSQMGIGIGINGTGVGNGGSTMSTPPNQLSNPFQAQFHPSTVINNGGWPPMRITTNDMGISAHNVYTNYNNNINNNNGNSSNNINNNNHQSNTHFFNNGAMHTTTSANNIMSMNNGFASSTLTHQRKNPFAVSNIFYYLFLRLYLIYFPLIVIVIFARLLSENSF